MKVSEFEVIIRLVYVITMVLILWDCHKIVDGWQRIGQKAKKIVLIFCLFLSSCLVLPVPLVIKHLLKEGDLLLLIGWCGALIMAYWHVYRAILKGEGIYAFRSVCLGVWIPLCISSISTSQPIQLDDLVVTYLAMLISLVNWNPVLREHKDQSAEISKNTITKEALRTAFSDNEEKTPGLK